MKIFDGQKAADKIAAHLKKDVENLKTHGFHPRLAIVAIQADERARTYIRAKEARAAQIGIETDIIRYDNHQIEPIKADLARLNNDPLVHGIIIQLPLPAALKINTTIDLITPEKDVDGLTSANAHAIENSQKPTFYPATPLAVLEILAQNGVDLVGKKIAVIGQGRLVGRPLTAMLKNAGADVRVADKNTPDISAVTRAADIIISATGSPRLITSDMVAQSAVVIDVGISQLDGKQVGDVDFEKVKNKASLITPTRGGVGPMTVVMLMQNVIEAAKAD
jgi:methylenetetrahydrofolate dehydrogenase (NADP+)/methenyltetrahydrofolate cyclohydrolase